MEKNNSVNGKGFSTLESDDASGGDQCTSFYDSGVCLTYNPSFPSGSVEVMMEKLQLFDRPKDTKIHTSQSEAAPRPRASEPISTIRPPTLSVEDLYKQDDEGDTCLHLAVIKPDVNAAWYIIKEAPIPDYLNIQNYFLQTPLHLAVITNQPKLVRVLVMMGASLMSFDRNGNTPLHIACMYGYLECVRQLLNPLSMTELQAVRQHCTDRGFQHRTVQNMLPSNLGRMNYDGMTCLHLASRLSSEDRYSIITYLVRDCCADINEQEGLSGYTILHQAIKAKDEAMVQFILNFTSLSIDKKCYSGATALGIAVCLQLSDLARMLQLFGAKLSEEDISNADPTNDMEDDFDDVVIGGQLCN